MLALHELINFTFSDIHRLYSMNSENVATTTTTITTTYTTTPTTE